MSLKYNIHQDPPRKDGQPAAKHLRTVDLKTVDNRALTQAMRRRGNAYSAGSCLGILIDLADTMPELLAKGFAVHLEGIGTFSPQVEGDVEETARGSRATNLRVGAVVFHPDAELLSEVNRRARFEHVLETRRSLPSDAEVAAFLDEHFARLHVIILEHNVLAWRYRARDPDSAICVIFALFEHDHGIGPWGNLPARRDAHAYTRHACNIGFHSHLNFTCQHEQSGKRIRATKRVRRDNCIAVNRRAIKRRNAFPCNDIVCNKAPGELVERYNLGLVA